MIGRRDLILGCSCAVVLMSTQKAIGQAAPLKLSTGASGGTFFEYGAGLSRLLQSKAGLTVDAVASGGTIENIRRIEDGSADLALAAMGPAYEAWTASAAPWLGHPPLRSGRALLPMYETPFHLATVTASGIQSVQELDGRSVGVGPLNGSNEQIFQKLAEGLGIRPILVNGDPAELATKVIRREIDVLFFGAGAPISAYVKIANAVAIRFLPLDGLSAEVLKAAFPYLTSNAIPPGTYRGQNEAVPTVALWNFLVCRRDISSQTAYAVARAVLGNPAEARLIHPAAIATNISNVSANVFMPFHPGALQYFSEIGVDVSNLPR
jgi:uncharacterized protein